MQKPGEACKALLGTMPKLWLTAAVLGTTACSSEAPHAADARAIIATLDSAQSPEPSSPAPQAAAPNASGSATAPAPVVEALDCNIAQAGSAPFQRLTAAEYLAAARSLAPAVTLAKTDLPVDEQPLWFTENVTTTISEVAVSQYLYASDKVSLALVNLLSAATNPPCSPSNQACGPQYIQSYGRLILRRALTAAEVTAYGAIFTSFSASPDSTNSLSGFWSGLNITFGAMLNSPDFLYHVELGGSDPSQPQVVPLTGYELASRLAFFLWAAPPDDALLKAAEAGTLTDPAQLQVQAKRLLADAKGQNGIQSFYTQLLGLQNLVGAKKDASAFPMLPLDQTTITAPALQETMTFVSSIILKGDAKFETLMTAPYGYPSGALFTIYDVPQPTGFTAGTKINYDPTQRAGLLTQESVLWNYAHTTETEPVQRGKLVVNRFLCQTVPPPPANVNQAPPPADAGPTARDRFVQHEADAACAACHVRMDPIGLSFEAYDATGMFRTHDKGNAIDLTGKITGTKATDGSYDGVLKLAQILAASSDAQDCAAMQWMRFALKRAEDSNDQCTQTTLLQRFQTNGHNIQDLILDIVNSNSFRYRHADPI